jgi:hypothetical protein
VEEQESSLLLSYAVPLIANVLNPLIVVRGIYTRRWIWIVAGLVGQVFIYSFTGYRSSALSPLVLLGAYLLFRRNSRPASIIMPLSVTVLAVTMWVTDRFLSSIEFTSLLVRRFLITPGLLTAGYVAVFHDIDKVYLSHSFLKPFLVYPYAQEPPLLVGELFFHNPETNANANLLADGYANFGFPGMLIECLVLVVLLWAVDDGCRGLPIGICATVFVMPVLALADSGIFTTMLTHGFVAAIVACLLMPRTGWERVPRRSERS